MRKMLLVAAVTIAVLFSPVFNFNARAQLIPSAKTPSDSSLKALVNRYVHTPVYKTIRSNGEVFLQRDMSDYLHANVFTAPPVSPTEMDHGHDHKDAMLRSFLNRPHPSVATLTNYFDEAAREFGVPVSILKATAQVQSNWAQVSESIYGSWGIMGLIENQFTAQLSSAAALIRVTTDAIKNDAQTNIRAAAALLASYQGVKPKSKLEDWFEAVKSLTGLWDEPMKNELAVRIYDVIKSGSKTATLWGEIISIDPVDVSLSKTAREPEIILPSAGQRTAAVDYPSAVPNFTTCNFNSRPAGSVVKYYFVHYVATGTYQGAVSWFKNCTSSVSAHYVIKNSDGEVSQVVAEADRAWSQGVAAYNDLGIGVEHEVLATNLSMWDSDPMLTAAANLCINVCNRRAIPKQRRINNGDAGIYGHSDVRSTDCPNMTAAQWTNFLSRVNSVNVAAPLLYSIANSGSATEVTATWKANIEPNLAGYRLYYATSDALTSWALAADETTLTPTTTSITLAASQFVVPPPGHVYHFKLTAVVTDGTNPLVESSASDIYSRSSGTSGPKVLIVDGFDRNNGSYTGATHSFATNYFKAFRNKATLQVSTVANEKVEDGTFVLNNYDIVMWFVGDESSAHVVLSTAEKNAVKSFLDNGGKLIISGSEIAYNIGRSAATTYDLPFMTNYLKSTYVNDGSITYTPATGIAGTPFEGLNIPFGIVYTEDFPDAIAPSNGSTAILNYSVAPNKAGVAYKGTFGSGTKNGGLIYLSFTLETALDSSMTAFMGKALSYFDVAVTTAPTANDDAITTQTRLAKRINVLSNDYTNGEALNMTTLTIVTPPSNGTAVADTSGNITYTSNLGFTGSDSYSYRIQNVKGQYSNTATVSVVVVATNSCDPDVPSVEDIYPKRDLRGAWVSTVSNIDWPSSRSLTTAQQQTELLAILDTLQRTGINTVFLQVRPESDALYASSIEPWSYWLTGLQGRAPSPLWDPLAYAITEAHKRGMELHAWLNPYRAKQSTPALAANHVAALHPDWTFAAGTLTMLNPGLPAVRNHVTQVIADIASRYDVDGIHFDDYFYPSANFTNQDSATYSDYNPTNISNIADWRRNNVNQLIAKVYDTLSVINSASNRNIVFGVSPAGIWKSGTPAGTSGNSSYSALYCDPIAWMQAGKVDYVAPQLYWKVTGPQDYNALSKWWSDQAETYGRHIYPGLALYKLLDANDWAASEIERQIALNRDQNRPKVKGQILFSTKQVMVNAKGVKTALQSNQFRYKSIPAVMPWKDAVCPNAPSNIYRDGDTLRWDAPAPATDGDLAKRYVVYRFSNMAEASTHLNDASKVYAVVYSNKIALTEAEAGTGYFTVTVLDKANNESTLSVGVVLPVTGLDLQVRLSGNTAVINWTTRTEMNTARFEVERSLDGRNFQKLTTLTAAGNSAVAKNYNSQDFLLGNGTFYYRIKTVDRDERSSYSAVKSITYRNTSNQILVGPNPFQTTINISSLQGFKQVELMDMAGRILVAKAVANQTNLKLNLADLPAGIYHLRAIKNNGEKELIKLVKL